MENLSMNKTDHKSTLRYKKLIIDWNEAYAK